jgi:RNA polymerase sigma-70 factor (ECF subfamily)
MDRTPRSCGEDFSRALYEEHGAALTAYVQRLVHGDRQLAEDIVQESVLRAWTHADGIPVRARRPWLFVTARHLVVDAARARRARPAEVGPELIEVVGQDDGLDAALDGVLLTDALRALSAEHRQVLVDAYYRGQTAAQIATARGLPAGTVRSRLHYALKALRLALQERGVDG